MTHENETALGMDQDTNIALDVSAIPIIKHDILTVAGQMDAAVYDGVLYECEKKLSAKIDEVFNEFNSSNSTDKESLFEQLNTLFEGQSDMQAIISQLRNAIVSLETGGEEGSVLSEETIKNVLNAALTTESFWTDDTIGAPSVVGQKIIGLVGEFGEIKASSLKGDTIEGLTLQSHLKDEDDKPLWQINKDGDGHLAGGNISWGDDGTIQIGSETKGLNFNSNGELTFGSDVKLSWADNIEDDSKPTILSADDIKNTVITKDYVESLKIKAADIEGDTITGKTIQSSDNSWQINKDGDGHLAGGNISWGDDGTIQIGSETKGLNFNSNGELTFGSDVTLSWNNISDTSTVASKNDIPNLDNYATKDYVDQNSGGFTTEIGNNWIKAADVTCENLKVSKLNTNYGKDYNTINAEQNYLKVLNGHGDTSLTLTSDDVIDFTLVDGQTSVASSSSTDFYKEFTMSKNTSDLYYNSTSQTIELCEFTVKSPIGEQVYSLDIDVNIGLGLYSSINSLNYSAFMIPKGGEGNQTSSKAQYSLAYNPTYVGNNIRIEIYRKNSDGTIPSSPTYTNYQRTGFGYSQSYPNLSVSTTLPNKWATTNLFYNNIDVAGTYVIKLVIPQNIITLESGNNYTKTYLCVGYTVSTSGSYNDFVFIGNDGIVVNSNKNTFILNNDGLFMQAGTKSNFYGIKITPSGMYFCNGGSTWRNWEPSSD